MLHGVEHALRVVERRQGYYCFANGVFANSISQRFLALGVATGNTACKYRERVIIEIDMGIINELIGSVLFYRIATGTLKGVAVAASLDIVAADRYRNLIFAICVAVDEFVVLVARHTVNIECHTIDRNRGTRIANCASHFET